MHQKQFRREIFKGKAISNILQLLWKQKSKPPSVAGQYNYMKYFSVYVSIFYVLQDLNIGNMSE